MIGGVLMKKVSKRILFFAGVMAISCILAVCRAQDRLPVSARLNAEMQLVKPMREMSRAADTIAVDFSLPPAFRGTGCNDIVDSLDLLSPVFERLRLMHAGLSEDTVRIVHIGDSHIRGHIYPQTTGALLAETFGAVSYTDMGVNGATCLTFTHPARLSAIVALRPELLILSFGTNESHNRRYNAHVHYNQIDELVKLLQARLPGVPILLTTPPGSYESFRQRRRRRTYSVNPRTATAVKTIHAYARDHGLLVWDMYTAVGGSERACQNWTEAQLMRPDHVHYLPEGYVLQGKLFYQALIKAYNAYVFH